MAIMINLCSLTHDLYMKISHSRFHKRHANKFCSAALAIPIVFLVLAYAFDTDDIEIPNGLLNVSVSSTQVFRMH